jgi:hypothetical protein
LRICQDNPVFNPPQIYDAKFLLHDFYRGFFGGFCIELLRWWSIREKSNFPVYAKSPAYWVISFVMALAGGLISLLQFGASGPGIAVFQIGISAPLILQKLSTTIPAGFRGKGAVKKIVWRDSSYSAVSPRLHDLVEKRATH